MKKKLALLLGMLMLAISLTACGKDPKTVDYNGRTYDELADEMESFSYSLENDYMNLAMNCEPGMVPSDILTEDFIDQMVEKGIPAYYMSALVRFSEIAETYGAYQGYSDFEITKAGKTTTSDIIMLFKNDKGESKEITFEIVYESWNMEITGTTIEPVKTLGEKMANAGMNTLISMSIVFIVLILISLIIYAFNIFPYLEKKKKEKAMNNQPAVETAAPAFEAAPVTENLTDDLELVAVIAAAIAASENCSTSDFVVRSINRR